MEGKKIAIVGASGGVGSVVTQDLISKGARVFLGGRTEESLAKLGSELNCCWHALRADRFDEADAFILKAVETMGGLDGVVNCAGSLLLKPAQMTTEHEFEQTFADNAKTAFSILRAVTRNVRKGPLSLVFMSSAVARVGLANHDAIALAKAGVAGLTRSAAASHVRRRFRVNAVAPGLVETPLTESITSRERSRQASLALHPAGRLGKPEEIAKLIVWLLSDESSWMTGQVLHLDGGLAHIKL